MEMSLQLFSLGSSAYQNGSISIITLLYVTLSEIADVSAGDRGHCIVLTV